MRRILEIEDHHDAPGVALDRRRNVRIAPVERKAMDALAGRRPIREQFGFGGVRDVVDAQPAGEVLVGVGCEPFVVDDHRAVGDAHFVRVPTGRHVVDRRNDPRRPWIGDIDDRRAVRRGHVPDVERRPVDPHLPAARDVDVGDERGVDRLQTTRPSRAGAGRVSALSRLCASLRARSGGCADPDPRIRSGRRRV